MKALRINLVVLSLFCLMLVGTGTAEDRKAHQTITLSENIVVNNTILEKGKYRITFYTDTGEVKFREEDGDVVLQTKVIVAMMEDDADRDEMHMTSTSKGQVLTRLVFNGHEKYAVFNDTNVSTSDN